MQDEYNRINQNKEPLTRENLRTFTGFENINDEEADAIVESVDKFCRFIYWYHQNMINERRKNEK